VNSSIVATADILGSNNRVTAYGWKALAGSVIGYAMDGFDLLIVGFMLPVIFSAAIALLGSIYVLDIIATVFFIPELRGKQLE
jgi:hypothetical protein